MEGVGKEHVDSTVREKLRKGKDREEEEEEQREEEGGDKSGSRPLIPAAAAVL